jgi:hypothetical protein
MSVVVPRNTSLALLRNTWNPQDGTELQLVTRLAAGTGAQTRAALERVFAACCANGELVSRETGPGFHGRSVSKDNAWRSSTSAAASHSESSTCARCSDRFSTP